VTPGSLPGAWSRAQRGKRLGPRPTAGHSPW
jgi:hypothetical protein